jgi:glucose-6-phosphate-specific signal transduction histidine kinase
VMAVIQVAAVVFAARTARRVGDVVNRLEHDVRPIVTNLQAMSADAARATSSAAAQVERAEQMLGDLSKRVDDTVATLQHTILAPARDGLAVLHGIKAVLAAFRSGDTPKKRPSHAEEEDALFIG